MKSSTQNNGAQHSNSVKKTRDMVILAMLGTIMYASKVAMAALPNIHLIALFIVSFTIVYRFRALIPIYIYIFLEGIFGGFTTWWIPYLYIWTILWGIIMLLPRKIPDKIAAVLYPIIAGLFGLSFGTLFAPAQALFFHLNFQGMISWIIAGLPFDALHAVGNTVSCLLVLPLSKLLFRLDKSSK